MAEEKQILSKGRLRYVEPTNFYQRRMGNYADSINFPYEDYNMAVDLSIRITDRYSCGYGKEGGEIRDINYSTNKGTISFLGGTEYSSAATYLTTTYTDVSMTDPKTNTSECLGIESINISYQSWMYPQVVIKFVDLRGATVMLKNENGYYNPNDMGVSSSVYKAFFTFPYPIFTLKVKGFYGNGVTYKLAVEKTDLEFDAETGNFNITASFIGYMYGIYADMPMTYLAIAPYTEEGREYWNRMVNQGVFMFKDSNGNNVKEMLTIPELRLQVAKAAASEEGISAAAAGEQIIANYDEQISRISALEYNFPMSDWYEPDNVDYIYNIGGNSGTFNDLRTTVSAYVNTVIEYDSIYGTSYMNYFTDLARFGRGEIDLDTICFVRNGTSSSLLYDYKPNNPLFGRSNKEKYEEYVQPYVSVRKYVNNIGDGISSFYLYILPKTEGLPKISGFKESIEARIKELEEKKKKQDEEYKEMREAAIEKVLGFKPSIRNVYNLIFAHMDTFIHTFYSMTRRIKDQLDGKNGANRALRRKTHYALAPDSTDTERETLSIGAENSNSEPRNRFLPPFTAFYKIEQTDGENKRVLQWPEELLNGSDLEEVGYVKDFINAAEMYAVRNDAVEETIRNLSTTNADTTTSILSDTPSTTVRDFIPLTNYDFIYKDQITNPYLGVSSKVYNGEDGIEGEILGIFAHRAYYYLCSNGAESRREAKAFGVLEALNVYKAIGDKYSNAFTNFVLKYADKNNERSERSQFINVLTSTETGITNAWRRTSAPNLSLSLFSQNNGNLSYNYHRGFQYDEDEIDASGYVKATLTNGEPTDKSYMASDRKQYKMFPLYFNSFDSLVKEYVNEKGNNTQIGLLGNQNFLSLTNIDTIYKTGGNTPSTFFIYETRDYIKNIFDNLKNEVKNTEVSIEEKNGNYTSEEGTNSYPKVVRTNRTLRNYKNNIKDTDNSISSYNFAIVDRNENAVTPMSLKRMMVNGTEDERKNYYIKFPAVMNCSTKESLFNSPIYRIQNSILAKAYLFLQAIPLRNNVTNGGIDKNNESGLSMKVRLLREGSYYWREDTDEVIFRAGEIPESLSYKVPKKSQCLLGIKGQTADSYSEFTILTDKDTNKEYLSWETPIGLTQSRRRVLKQYFMDWANDTKNGFAANESRLTNRALYDSEPTTFQYENSSKERFLAYGLDINGLVTATYGGTLIQTDDALEAQRLQQFLQDLFFTVCTTMELYDGLVINNGSQTNFECSETAMSNAFKGFIDELKKIYGQTVKEIQADPLEYRKKQEAKEQNNPFKNTDLRLSTYMTMKSLYDKWLCSPYNGPDKTWSLKEIYTDGNTSQSDFSNFMYVDSFYHDIGYKLCANITKVASWLSDCLPTSNIESGEGSMQYMGKSVFEFLCQVAQDVGAVLHAFPQRFGMMTGDDLLNMFTPISINNNWAEDASSFVFMYSYKPSEHLGDTDNGNVDMNGWSPNGDGYNLTDDEIIGRIMGDSGYTVPAFGVTFAKQNQTIFKNISLKTENAGVTEASLAATFDIAAKSSESPRESTLYGQDLYRVYSQYSYDCGVDMMGNMQIMPLMYFQLNNIPLWKGAYMVIKVTHSITAGNITTHFEGVRQNKNAIPLADGAVITDKDSGASSNGIPLGGDNYPTTGENGTVLRVGEGQDILPNPNKYIPDSIDFNESNIAKEKPIICLTAAHSPASSKSDEWRWSSSAVTRIKEILSEYTFSDGTSYSENIQICNKNSGRGYTSREVKNLIEKYGSKQVISIVPHWNGGAGQYHMTMVNKAQNVTREDSKQLAECMLAEMTKVYENSSSFSSMPLGMMKGGCRIENLYPENTDWAPQMNCACVLTENWFQDWPAGSPYWDERPCGSTITYLYRPDNKRYTNGRAWLETDGLEIVSQAHAKAIKRYIDSLS